MIGSSFGIGGTSPSEIPPRVDAGTRSTDDEPSSDATLITHPSSRNSSDAAVTLEETGPIEEQENPTVTTAEETEVALGPTGRPMPVLPEPTPLSTHGNARIISIHVGNPIVSNAATTATVSVGLAGGSNTYFSTAQDVKGAIGNFSQAATANWVPAATSQSISCTYTETGTASSAGTHYVHLTYCVL